MSSSTVHETRLATFAVRCGNSAGREHIEPGHAHRNPYQRDRERILHSSSFRRLQGKTQVFTGDLGDYHRTRLTHTLEVASIARTIGRVLRLNEDLIEALALFHDLGHPPFGHAGEQALDEILAEGFCHNRFALRIARELEQPYPHYPGMNLSFEVIQGQLWRADKQSPSPHLECQAVDVADSIAYNAHDLDDALKVGIVSLEEASRVSLVCDALESMRQRYGDLTKEQACVGLFRQLVDSQVTDVLTYTESALRDCQQIPFSKLDPTKHRIGASPDFEQQQLDLQQFLYQRVYSGPSMSRARQAARAKIQELFIAYDADPMLLPDRFLRRLDHAGRDIGISDYIAGMTDRYCLQQYALVCSPGSRN